MKTKLTLACMAVACIMMVAGTELFAQKSKSKKGDNKVHLKIIENENGVERIIDTTFDGNDSQAIENFMQQHNMSGKVESDGDDTHIYMYKYGDDKQMSDEDQKELEKNMEQLKVEMNSLKDMKIEIDSSFGNSFNFNFNFDSLPGKDFHFKMNPSDKKELEQLEEELRNQKFDMKIEMPELPELPDMPDFKYDMEGMSDDDKKKFDEHMQKAREEMQKAFDMMKDSSGKMKMRFYFNSDSLDDKDGGFFPGEHGDFMFAMPPMAVSSCCAKGNDKGKTCCIIIGDHDSMPGTRICKVQGGDDKNKGERRVVIISKGKDVGKAKATKEPKTEKTAAKPATKPAEAFGDLTCFPNPNSGTFDVKFTTPETGALELKIMDAAGKEIVDDNFENFTGTFSKQYDLSKEGKGTYFLMIKQGANWAHKKVVVK